MSQHKHIPVNEEHSDQTLDREYWKLTLVIGGIWFVSLLIFLLFDGYGPFNDLNHVESFLAQFMGVFFIVFASFKLVNLKSFVHGFSMYDLIAKRSSLYAKAYPFIQLIIGVLMFVVPSQAFVHGVAAIISLVALFGVVQSVRNKQQIHCACLGNVIKMPLATVSGIEDGAMFVIASYMFIAMVL